MSNNIKKINIFIKNYFIYGILLGGEGLIGDLLHYV